MKLSYLFDDSKLILGIISNIFQNTINEEISQKDFFDFYALVNAFDEPHFPVQDPKVREEIEIHLKDIANYIYNDHMKQLASYIIDKFGDRRKKYVRNILKYEGDTIAAAAEIIKYYFRTRDPNEYASMPTNTTPDMLDILPKQYLKLVQAQTLREKILAIDKIHNMRHMGGRVSDYFEEPWLKDALNIRVSAQMPEILNRASGTVRELLTSAQYGIIGKTQVSEAEKLVTAIIRNPYMPNPQAKIVGDEIHGSITITKKRFPRGTITPNPIVYDMELYDLGCISDGNIDIPYKKVGNKIITFTLNPQGRNWQISIEGGERENLLDQHNNIQSTEYLCDEILNRLDNYCYALSRNSD